MSFELVGDSSEETLITRVSVINPYPVSIPLPYKYRCLFHGADVIRYGRHTFRFPITNMWYKRVISAFQAEFASKVKVDFGSAGFDEI